MKPKKRQRTPDEPPRKLTVPKKPTTVPPGPDKVAVMEARYERGEQVRHPADARWEGDERPVLWVLWQEQLKREGKAA